MPYKQSVDSKKSFFLIYERKKLTNYCDYFLTNFFKKKVWKWFFCKFNVKNS